MAVSFVQSTHSRTTGSQDSHSLAFASNVTAGNLIVVGAICYNTAAITAGAFSDTLGHTYQLAIQRTAHSGTSAAIAYVPNISGGANTVTLNVSGNNGYVLVISEWSGAATSSPLDGTGESAGTGTTATTGNVVPANNGAVVSIMSHEAGGSPTLTPGSGWTLLHENEDSSEIPYCSERRAATASTTYNGDYALGASIDWVSVAAAFKEAAGGGGGTAVKVSTLLSLGVGK